MRLSEWLKAKKISVLDFAKKAGVSSMTVYRWQEDTIPDREKMQKIVELTGGAVTANDFYGLKDDGALA